MSSGRDEMLSRGVPDEVAEVWRQEQMDRIRRGLAPLTWQQNPFHPTPMGQVDQLGRDDWARESHLRSFVNDMEAMFTSHKQQTQQLIIGLERQVNDLRSMYDYIYRYHPEVIKEYDVIQRTKERLNVKGE